MRENNKPRSILGVSLYPALIVLGCLLIIIGAKFYLIRNYGSDLPFWDQWDGEAAAMFMPAAQGHLTAKDFFQPHNEHRIVFTRLLAFGLERLNGQWDARLEMTVNVFIHVLAIGLLLVVLRPLIKNSAWIIACAFATVLCSFPYAWENTIEGFQSQFYILLFFSIAHLAGTFAAKEKSGAWYAGQIAAVCCLFSMASGFISAIVALFVIFLDAVRLRRMPSLTRCGLAAFNGLLIVVGWFLKTTVAAHESLKSHNLSDLVSGIVALLAWPCPYWPIVFLGLLPPIVFFFGWFRTKEPNAPRSFILAILLWGFLQIAALALGRGGNHATLLSPRYYDLLVVTLIITAALWSDNTVTAASGGPRRAFLVGLNFIWWIGITIGLISQCRVTMTNFVRPMTDFNRQRIDVVRNYVETKTKDLYKAPPVVALPYPSPSRLAWLLDDPGVRAVLPASVRPSLSMKANEITTSGFVESDASKPTGTPIAYPYWTNPSPKNENRFQSELMEKQHYTLIRFLVKSSSAEGAIELAVIDGNRRKLVSLPPLAKERWQATTVWFPSPSFKVQAHCAPGGLLSFSAPIEVGLGSWLCQAVLSIWLMILLGGVLIAACGLAGYSFQSTHRA